MMLALMSALKLALMLGLMLAWSRRRWKWQRQVTALQPRLGLR